jgi:hypothetical protein
MLDKGSTPTIIKIEGNEAGSCFTIQNFQDIPESFGPKIPLQAISVKRTKREAAKNEIALTSSYQPSLPSHLERISSQPCLMRNLLRFWAKMIMDAQEQHDLVFGTASVVKNLIACTYTI